MSPTTNTTAADENRQQPRANASREKAGAQGEALDV